MPLVNTFIIGSQKAGTTSLFEYLRQSPQVRFSAVKELTYFIDEQQYRRGDEYLHSFFQDVPPRPVMATAHVHMLPSIDAPQRLYRYNPQARLIAVLRDPVGRAWSSYNYAVANGWESSTVSFEEAMQREAQRLLSNDHRERFDLTYFHNGLYHQHLVRWLKLFNRNQMLLLRSDDLRHRTAETMQSVYRFLEIGNEQPADLSRLHNKARTPRSKALDAVIFDKNSRVKKLLRNTLPDRWRIAIRQTLVPAIKLANSRAAGSSPMPKALRKHLLDYYRQDLQRLLDDFGIDLR